MCWSGHGAKILPGAWRSFTGSVDQAVTKIVPVIVPKATDTSDTSETFKGISGDIAPNVYKGFGANPRQDWVQKKGGGRLRNPVLYPPELQGQKTPKAIPAKSLQ